ncbi:MAG TPA: integration host factor subunit alpha [Nitrospira sp.]
MRKLDIARRIHQQAGITEIQAADLLDWILELLKSTLQQGEEIVIAGFGKFAVRSKAARTGRNPRTGEATTISARRVVTFHASPLLKAEMNPAAQESMAPWHQITRADRAVAEGETNRSPQSSHS